MPEAAAAHRKAICGADRLYPGIRGPYQEPGEKAPAAESRGATRGGKQPTAEGRDATRGGKRSAATPHEAGNDRQRRATMQYLSPVPVYIKETNPGTAILEKSGTATLEKPGTATLSPGPQH